MNTYTVLSSLTHDGKSYARGDVVELSDEAAAQLLGARVVQSDPLPQEPEPPSNARLQSPEAKAAGRAEKGQPKVGGEPNVSGEPSLDGQDTDSTSTDAQDVTQEPLERMTRAELDELARTEGVQEASVADAKTKSDVISLITAKRAGAPEPSLDGQDDPSAGL